MLRFLKERLIALTRPHSFIERQPLGGEWQFKSELWGLMTGQARSSIYLIQHYRFSSAMHFTCTTLYNLSKLT